MTNESRAGRELFVVLPGEPPMRLNRLATGAAPQPSLFEHQRVWSDGAAPAQVLKALGLQPIDELAPNDATLVALDTDDRAALLRALPGARLVSAERLQPMWLHRADLCQEDHSSESRPYVQVEIAVVDAVTGAPLPDVEVMLFSDRAERVGIRGLTDRFGKTCLQVPGGLRVQQSLEAYPRSGHWPSYLPSLPPAPGTPCVLACTPVNPAHGDVRRHLGFEGEDGDGDGVRVGVIDTGCSRHPDLRIGECSRNLVRTEPFDDLEDELGHGTHVAGVIAGRGTRGRGVRGVAPDVTLMAYRVFGRGESTALSFDICKGIRQAVADGCDLINLSLGGAVDVPDIRREIELARNLGVVCLGAAGNDYRRPVSYPARYSSTIAVTAFGRQGTWPAGAAQILETSDPRGSDPQDFIAAFSNAGREIQLTAPGLGIVSTSPDGYAVMDGTSMACPVATGALARLLGRAPQVLAMRRDLQRANAIARLAENAVAMGFGSIYEGAGCLK